jgi:xanthine dehydrogenase/oxidase
MLACETIVEHVAAYLKRDPFTIRSLNLFKEGDTTHYGQVLELWNVPRILNELTQSSDFIRRQTNVKEFNQQNKYRKRGISLIPNKFGIGFFVRHLNQAGALVHIYKDGSVVLTHGGVELGQGLYTKMISIAAEVLRCDIDRIRISETATDKIHNTSPTGGSIGSDLNGMAIRDACEQLRQRLDTLMNDNNINISWEDLVKQAYFARLDLCARGFYATPNMFDADFSQNRFAYNYFTQGAVVTEVELDVLTGDWHLLRVDILMVCSSSTHNTRIYIYSIIGCWNITQSSN